MASFTQNRATGLSLAILILWLIFTIIAWIFIVISLAREEWVQGTDSNGSYDVGLFRQCSVYRGEKSCFFADGINVKAWQAAAAFFILGLIFLTITIIVGFITLCFLQLITATKILLSITNLFMMIAIFLIPIGFAWLDDPCDGSGREAQCGLVCDGNGSMDFFKLCAPFKVGSVLWLCIVGLIILFIGSWILACLQTRTYIVQTE
jgi:hypothetical protein